LIIIKIFIIIIFFSNTYSLFDIPFGESGSEASSFDIYPFCVRLSGSGNYWYILIL